MVVLLSQASDAQVKIRSRTIIVEDDATSRDAMLRILEMLGFDVGVAASVAEGLTALQSRPSSLILDLMLPDGNGIEILQRIRAEKLPIRVAILTGADRPMIEEAQRLGPDATFTKPVDLQRLLSWLKAA